MIIILFFILSWSIDWDLKKQDLKNTLLGGEPQQYDDILNEFFNVISTLVENEKEQEIQSVEEQHLAQINNLQSHIENLEADNNHLTEMYAVVSQNLEELEAQISTLSNDNRICQEQKQGYLDNLHQSSFGLSECQMEKETLTSQNTNLQSQISNLEANNQHFTENYVACQSSLSQITQEYQTCSSSLEECNNKPAVEVQEEKEENENCYSLSHTLDLVDREQELSAKWISFLEEKENVLQTKMELDKQQKEMENAEGKYLVGVCVLAIFLLISFLANVITCLVCCSKNNTKPVEHFHYPVSTPSPPQQMPPPAYIPITPIVSPSPRMEDNNDNPAPVLPAYEESDV